MENFNFTMAFLVFLVIGIVFFIVVLAILRETLFWYWRSKGILNQPKDILNQNHETALIIRKSIDGLKAADAATRSSLAKSRPNIGPEGNK